MHKNFCSDNVTGACPEVMEAVIRANEGTAAGYGGGFFASQHVEIDGSKATAINITGNKAGNDGIDFTRTDRSGSGFGVGFGDGSGNCGAVLVGDDRLG